LPSGTDGASVKKREDRGHARSCDFDPEMILALQAGVDVFRLNFSHGTHKDQKGRFEAIRRIETMTGRPI
jgi:pyruvate kinase